jgi:Tfp pilus assembly protein PilF
MALQTHRRGSAKRVFSTRAMDGAAGVAAHVTARRPDGACDDLLQWNRSSQSTCRKRKCTLVLAAFHSLSFVRELPVMTANAAPPFGPRHAVGLSAEAEALLVEARRAINGGQLEAAGQVLARVLGLAPDCTEAYRLLGIAALMGNDAPKAIDHLRHALSTGPDDPTLNMNLGSALIETGENDAGLAYLQRACELAPESAASWYNFGKALQFSACLERAREILQRAVSIDPGHIQARNALAGVLASLGDAVAAVAINRETLRRQPDCATAWFALANLKIESFSKGDIAQLQAQFGRSDLADDSRLLLGFTLAQALEDQDDCATAFDVLARANALKRGSLYWSRQEEGARVDAIAHAFAHPSPAPLNVALGEEVIFVVCLPRSGSTLTEQILASHPQVDGADEVQVLPQILIEESARRGLAFPGWVPSATAGDWHRLGKEYLARTRRWRQGRPRFTDKNVDNWAFVGAALAMLPGARVVNSRRDPLETCFALYRQLFGNGSVHYSYDLDDIASYYAGYARLSRLWQQRYPRRYFDHEYEALQADPEAQIRRLLDFCGLPFDPRCLAFHQTSRSVLTISAAQVRQPLRRDTARSPRYGAKLDPLRAKLRAMAKTFQ